MEGDNITRVKDRARWGFDGSKDEIKVAPQTAGETGEGEGLYESGAAEPSKDEGAARNGGGEETPKRSRKKAEPAQDEE